MRGLSFLGALAGILLGLGIGLGISWFVWPNPFSKADPAELRLDSKDDYLRMIATAYSLDGDMALALQELAALGLPQRSASIAGLISRETEPRTQQALIHFAVELDQLSVALARPTFTPRPTKTRASEVFRSLSPTSPPVSANPTLIQSVETITPELLPLSSLPPPNPQAPYFRLDTKTALDCGKAQGQPRFEVEVKDARGNAVSGIGIEVIWNQGDEIFYTGLKPERGVGYAELAVKPGTYSLRLTDAARSDIVSDLVIESDLTTCRSQSPSIYGWKLVFQQSESTPAP